MISLPKFAVWDSVKGIIAGQSEDPFEFGSSPGNDDRFRLKMHEVLSNPSLNQVKNALLFMCKKNSSNYKGGFGIPMDPVFAIFLAKTGLNPISASWLGIICANVDIDCDDGTAHARVTNKIPDQKDISGNNSENHIYLTRQVKWHQSGYFKTKDLPKSLVSSLSGKKLLDFIRVEEAVPYLEDVIITSSENGILETSYTQRSITHIEIQDAHEICSKMYA
jgi:hypothetical protein